jgi:hypothetical protein
MQRRIALRRTSFEITTDAVPFRGSFGVRTACPPVCGRPRVAFATAVGPSAERSQS